MATRLDALRRIAAVQDDMKKLVEWRLSQAGVACRDAIADRERLDGLVGGADPLGAALARAALHATKTVDRRLAAAEAERELQQGRLNELQRREHALGAALGRAEITARREGEARDLRDVLDAWLAQKQQS